jgi:ATP-binding cassette subfamily C (CFTR/MRP) protein 4
MDSKDLEMGTASNSDSTLNSIPLPKSSTSTINSQFRGVDGVDYPGKPDHEDNDPPESESDKRSKSKGGYNTANPFSKFLWCWLDPLFCKGLRKELEQEDLYDPQTKAKAEILSQKFERYWEMEQNRGRKPSLFRILFRVLWLKLIFHFLLAALKLALQIAQAIFVGLISEYFVPAQPTNEETMATYLYAMGLSLVVLLSAFVHNHGFLQAQEIGMLSRIICTSAIYKKILRLDQKTLGQFTFGKILNLASNDVRKLDFAFLYSPYLLLAPLHLVTVILLLWLYAKLGPYCLVGLCLFIFWIPLQWGVSKLYAILRLRAANYTDSRVRIMNDIITGIKVIKMYAWENAFKKVIADARRKEIWNILLSALFRACNDGFYLVSIAWFNLLTFSVYASVPENPPLTPTIVYTSIALVTGLRLSTMVYMVESILGVQDARVSITRIQVCELHTHFNMWYYIIDTFDTLSEMKSQSLIVHRTPTVCNIIHIVDE